MDISAPRRDLVSLDSLYVLEYYSTIHDVIEYFKTTRINGGSVVLNLGYYFLPSYHMLQEIHRVLHNTKVFFNEHVNYKK